MPATGKKNHGGMRKGHSRQMGIKSGGRHRQSGQTVASGDRGQRDASSGSRRHVYNGQPPAGSGKGGK